MLRSRLNNILSIAILIVVVIIIPAVHGGSY